jgi:hypothetical protein
MYYCTVNLSWVAISWFCHFFSFDDYLTATTGSKNYDTKLKFDALLTFYKAFQVLDVKVNNYRTISFSAQPIIYKTN